MGPVMQPKYFPVLKWKMGEYQALSRLSAATKRHVTPIIVLPPIGYDFEKKRLLKTIDEHLKGFPNKLVSKWGKRRSMIDFDPAIQSEIMASGAYLVDFIFDELSKLGSPAIPVIRWDSGTVNKSRIIQAAKRNALEICIRVDFDQFQDDEFSAQLDEIVEKSGIERSIVHIVVDLGAPESFEPYDVFSDLVSEALSDFAEDSEFGDLVLLSTAFPESVTRAVKQFGSDLARHDWALFKEVYNKCAANNCFPHFGDHAVEFPAFTQMDMRFVKPAGKLIYTTRTSWRVIVGPNVRDNGFKQYVQHTKEIRECPEFAGAEFSTGDKYISEYPPGGKILSNLTTWKWVAINHHITYVVAELVEGKF